ncbi:hypothetical protein [Nocardia callitridis]|uniref:Uncharacterized protein n=1 Tax=Nocardia callitridis TaxID=648753 RepID=A0ABP9KEJ1_9NOCA
MRTADDHRARTTTLAACTFATLAAVVAAGTGFGAGTASADTGVGCLWAGAPYAEGESAVAGGSGFTCGNDGRGGGYWFGTGPTDAASTVSNPGAASNPAGRFSAGARQPGTGYTDYCVGSQLIEGAEDVYQVVSDANGFLYWKAAVPIDQWAFDAGEAPQTTWHSSSSCYDGVLI